MRRIASHLFWLTMIVVAALVIVAAKGKSSPPRQMDLGPIPGWATGPSVEDAVIRMGVQSGQSPQQSLEETFGEGP